MSRQVSPPRSSAVGPGMGVPVLAGPHLSKDPVGRAAIDLVREALKDPLVREDIRAIIQAAREDASADVGMVEPLIDAREAAKLLGMSPPAVRAAAFRGALPCVHVGRLLRFRPSQLRAVIR